MILVDREPPKYEYMLLSEALELVSEHRIYLNVEVVVPDRGWRSMDVGQWSTSQMLGGIRQYKMRWADYDAPGAVIGPLISYEAALKYLPDSDPRKNQGKSNTAQIVRERLELEKSISDIATRMIGDIEDVKFEIVDEYYHYCIIRLANYPDEVCMIYDDEKFDPENNKDHWSRVVLTVLNEHARRFYKGKKYIEDVTK